MRLAALLILAVVGLGLGSSTSCFVNRLSDRFACTTDDDCETGRACDQGYCIEAPCPAPCSSCNLTAMTCRVDCNSNRQCGDVQCPAGFDCTFRCNNGEACGAIDCTVANSCAIDCSGAGSCGMIRCGPGECNIDCTGAGACRAIECATSCRCDVDCTNLVACPSMACPQSGTTLCTDGGAAGGVCDPTEDPILCDTCP